METGDDLAGNFEKRNSTEALRLVMETALDAVVVMNRKGDVVDWNASATEIFGWGADEICGHKMADFIVPPRFRDAHARGLQRYLDTGQATVLGRRIEIWGIRRSGEEFPIELSISPIDDGQGMVFVGFLRDISERKSAERQREQHALKMEALYRAISFSADNNSFDDALEVCLASVQKLTGWPLGHIYLPTGNDPVRLMPSPVWHSSAPDTFAKLRAATAATSFAPGQGLPGRVWESREPEWIADVDAHPDFLRARWPGGIEIRAAFGFPIISSEVVIAVVEFFSETVEEPDSDLLPTLRAIGQQLGRVFERRRAEEALRQHASALEAEIVERVRAEGHQKLLLAEVNHRVKNVLAVVSAMATQTARNSKSVESFSLNFLARLQALDRAHSLVTMQRWQAVSMSDLVNAVLSPHRGNKHLSAVGDAVMLQPKAAVSVGLVLHELITNAAKYGALSNPNGKVALEWGTRSGQDSQVKISWVESGIGHVARPARIGFGGAMIRASIQHELQGQVEVSYGADGLRYDLTFPLRPSDRSGG